VNDSSTPATTFISDKFTSGYVGLYDHDIFPGDVQFFDNFRLSDAPAPVPIPPPALRKRRHRCLAQHHRPVHRLPPNWVVGLEGDWSWKNAESSLSPSSSVLIVDNFGDTSLRTDRFFGSVKQKSDYSIRGRLGTLITPWSLLYATGGVAFSEISGSFSYAGTLCEGVASTASPCTSSSSFATATATTAVTWNDTRTGYTVGGGWESELFPGWKWRAEYRWTDFGDYTKTFGLATRCVGFSGPASSCTASPSSSVSINLKESFHTFRIGLAFDL
jgi:outer membrane immunogenic protein